MKRLAFAACLIGASVTANSAAVWAGNIRPVARPALQPVPQPAARPARPAAANRCGTDLTSRLPARAVNARSGKSVINRILPMGGARRDATIEDEILSGNVPGFLRTLIPVTMTRNNVSVTLCVTPDYLAVGGDADFVRVPLGLPAAARIAAQLGFLLPTTKMVDAIYAQAQVQLAPAPMKPTSQMESTDYFWRHNRTVQQQRDRAAPVQAGLTAGQKKDIVLSNRLRAKPGRVAIYGWHRSNGKPIQPLSTVHGAQYADYSHGVRLVSIVAYVNGTPTSLVDILQDDTLARIVSSEGPITRPMGLMRSYH